MWYNGSMSKEKNKERTIVLASFCIILATALAQPLHADGVLPAYDDSAFPFEQRPAETRRIADELDAVVARAKETDAIVDAAFAAISSNDLVRVRLAKRREARSRTEAFARRYLERGDATGLGFAEQATADLDLFDKIFREEAANLAVAPRPENNPVVLRLADFGAKGDGRTDDAEAFTRAFEAVRALDGKPCILKLGKGRFLIGSATNPPPYTSEFGQVEDGKSLRANIPAWGLRNCAIEGESPETTQIRFGVYETKGIAFANCRNCTFRNAEVSFEQQPFLEGEVLAVERGDDVQMVDVRLTPGSLRPDDPHWKPATAKARESFGFEFTPDGELMPSARLLHWDCRADDRCQDLGGGVWRLFFRRDFDKANFDNHLKGIVPGGFLAIPNRCNWFPAIAVADCSFMTVEDVWVRNSRAGAVDAYYRSYMTTFHRFRVFPREGFRFSTDADGCFSAPGTFLLDCHFENMGDDGFNSLANMTVVHPSQDGMEVVRERTFGTSPAGSLVVFADPFTGQYLANRRVIAEGRDGEGRLTTRLDRPVPASFDGKVMFVPRFRGIGTIVSGCSWKNGRWTGVVIQTPDAIVENCHILNVWQEGVRMSFLGDFSEGPSPYNVLVRNCTVEKCGNGVVGHYRHSADGRKTWANATAAPIRAVEVVGCTFRDIPGTALKFDHSGDCRFHGNAFANVTNVQNLAVCEDTHFDN
jgi:hypothetical protein